MKKNYSITKLRIKKEDFDGYEHLNNAKYPIYFEKARDDLTKKLGVNCKTLLLKNKGFFVKSARYDYLNQISKNDNYLEIHSKLEYEKGLMLNLQQEMFNQSGLVAKANTECFFVDLKKGKPIRPLSSLIKKLL